MARFALLLTLLAAAVQSGPTPDILERDYPTGQLPDAVCKKVNIIVTVLKLYKATPFCSSFLGLSAATSTSTVSTSTVTSVKVTATVTAPTSVITSTATVTAASTSYVFRSGNPPTQKREAIEARNNAPRKPDYLQPFADDVISSGCKCLGIAAKTVVVSKTATTTVTKNTATTTTPLSTSTVTLTVPGKTTTLYPCATPVPTLVSTIPYGDAQSATNLNTANQLFALSDPRGASAQACCNTCYFGVANCIQAYYYSYQGCVVQQASIQGSGVGVSSSCPSGLYSGLTYTPNTTPAFRSTGNFAGPCGVQYNNL